MIHWSTKLQTALSDLEVEYSEEGGSLYTFKYYLDDSEQNEFIPIATTRPETILGDTAICVHPEDSRYKHYIGKKCRVPFQDRVIPIIADECVDREYGTGALKVTPGHDSVDYELSRKHNLPVINIINKDGTINNMVCITFRSMIMCVYVMCVYGIYSPVDMIITPTETIQIRPYQG